MEMLFLKILNMSITASFIAVAAIVLRFFLRKSPRWISCLLWALVALRLLIPFAFESPLSLMPKSEPIPAYEVLSEVKSTPEADAPQGNIYIDYAVSEDKIESNYPTAIIPQGGVVSPENNIPDTTPEIIEKESPQSADTQEAASQADAKEQNSINVLKIVSALWLSGMSLMILYCALSYLKIHRKVKISLLKEDNIYYCDEVKSPFILGLFRPKIYLPSNISDDHATYVIAHEKAHLKRRDHLVKPLGFALLTIHWFNPLMWLCYILLSKDIELACDERVIKDMNSQDKKNYSGALLSLGVKERMISACPLAFGEVSVKERIKSVLSYKKPAFWVSVVAIILCVTLGVCFLTNPVKNENENESENESEVSDAYKEPLPYITLPKETESGYIEYAHISNDTVLRDSYLKLYPETERFELMLSPLSSYLPIGTYSISGDKLTLDCDGNNDTYVFTFTEQNARCLKFVAAESAPIPRYRYSESQSTFLPVFEDGALFSLRFSQVSDVNEFSYDDILRTITDSYPWKRDDSSFPIRNFPYASYMYIRHSELSEVGYALIDLDHNGTDELIISGMDSPFVYDLFTISEGKVLHTFSSGERYAHYLYEDGYIERQWNGAAAVTGHDFMRLENGKLQFLERITIDAYYAEESGVIDKLEDATVSNIRFKSTSENKEDYVHISSEEALSLIDSHQSKAKRITLSLTPLSEYFHNTVTDSGIDKASVMFDTDSDGKEERCSLSLGVFNSTFYLTAINSDGSTESLPISGFTADISLEKFPLHYLKRIDNKLYLFVEQSSAYKNIWELGFENDMVIPTFISDADLIEFDIDGDGKEETLTVSRVMLQAKECPFYIKALDSGFQEYYGEFVLPEEHNLGFSAEGGKLWVLASTAGTNPKETRYELTVRNQKLVLKSNSGELPYWDGNYTLDISGNGFEEYSTETAQKHVIDSMIFDIDNDGILEDVIVGAGGTSGVCSIRIIASVNGTVKYNTFHTGEHLIFSFEKGEDGKVYLRGDRREYELNGQSFVTAETHKYEIKVINARITLTENGVAYGQDYWQPKLTNQ